MKKTVFALPLACIAGQTLAAGGHYVVEDALLVDQGGCELESWHSRFDSDTSESALLLTCNPTGHFDIGGGLVRAEEGGESDTLVEVAAKALFLDADQHRVGVGIATIATWSNDSSKVETVELLLPVTVNATERLMLHANVGYADEREERNARLWGVGLDFELHPRVALIAESFGTHRSGSTFHQGGLRFSLGEVELDLSYGRAQADSDFDVVTGGLIWAF